MTSTGLVYMMTPALACFYGGLVENKNFLNQLFLSVVCMAIIPAQWCLFGYSFAFGPGNSVFGSFQYAVLSPMAMVNRNGENIDKSNVSSVTSLAFVAFQCSFATITPALISGAVVGRMKLIPYMIFIFVWTTVCYDPLARWVSFNGGWLHKMGVLDFSGGLIVHLSSGISGLVAAIILGSRVQFDPDAVNIGQTNLAFTMLGTGLLWVGWMGFTGGAAFAANGIAALAIVNTNIGAASSMIIWIILDIINGKLRGCNSSFISIPGLCSASVVGLVVVTPAAGFIQPSYALLMGFIGGLIVYSFLACKKRFLHIDDTLDVFSCHGLGGMIGTILTGLFCQKDVNKQGNNGALYGNPAQFLHQLIGILVTCIYAGACTAIILLSLHFTVGIRIHQVDQARGLDNVVHGVIEPRPTQDIKRPIIQRRTQPSNMIATVNIEHE
ncbi:unnamed protein product [Rotaria magnacalcarata]|uniref:Ammonium transporter n=5 Tax=Rotaria magnacalcarata TaxID=392030 RepID=A0A820DH55_9BILA|nr:unnamed protein product [Rotaria magnacalcarata]CAF2237106.1 unnamed protein product [Rotaria magnacalcarata]CAF3919077.1 unnamed protein product [Rotaria magnacalcarata]CAF4232094.1 unnamed protein product [Rotaria magnacalcarata]